MSFLDSLIFLLSPRKSPYRAFLSTLWWPSLHSHNVCVTNLQTDEAKRVFGWNRGRHGYVATRILKRCQLMLSSWLVVDHLLSQLNNIWKQIRRCLTSQSEFPFRWVVLIQWEGTLSWSDLSICPRLWWPKGIALESNSILRLWKLSSKWNFTKKPNILFFYCFLHFILSNSPSLTFFHTLSLNNTGLGKLLFASFN